MLPLPGGGIKPIISTTVIDVQIAAEMRKVSYQYGRSIIVSTFAHFRKTQRRNNNDIGIAGNSVRKSCRQCAVVTTQKAANLEPRELACIVRQHHRLFRAVAIPRVRVITYNVCIRCMCKQLVGFFGRKISFNVDTIKVAINWAELLAHDCESNLAQFCGTIPDGRILRQDFRIAFSFADSL